MQQSKQEYAKKEKEKRLVLCAGFGPKGFTPAVRRNAHNFAKSRFFRRIGRAGPCELAIHATPQVIAAGFAHPTGGQAAGEIATIVKLTRISLLGPALFILGVVYARQRRKQAVYVGQRVSYARLIPAFVIFFLALAFLRTTGFLPEVTVHMTDRFLLGGGDRTFHLGLLLASAGKWLITGAMAAVGHITEFRALKTGGVRPFALGLASTGIIAVLGLAYASL